MHLSRWNDRGLLLIRVALGLVFVAHGWQKLAIFGHAGVTGFLASLGVPFPAASAVLLTGAELAGGLLMLAGYQTRVIGLLLGFVMSVAIFTVHLPNGFFLPDGMEFALTLLLVALATTATGGGAYSVDAWHARRRRAVGAPDPDLKQAA
jgi:putative oxidoreductase